MEEIWDWTRMKKEISLNEHVRKVGPNTDLERRMKR
jgi:hypothetical protein